jgi:hypothetical protein
MLPQTPLPVPTVRRLAVVVTSGAVVWMVAEFPDADPAGRKHMLTDVKRLARSAYDSFMHVTDADREAVRLSRKPKQETPAPRSSS